MENTVKEEVKSRKLAFLDRQKEKYPELNTDDEEELFGKINDDYDNYDSRIKSNDETNGKLLNLFNSDNRAASFLTKWKDGADPAIVLMEEFGDEFRDALEDPELRDKFAEANSKYNERIVKAEQMNDEAERNLDASLNCLDEAQKELGVDDDTVGRAFEFYNAFVNDAIVNKISKESWMMFIKALNYDADVAEAEEIGEVKGKNIKIDESKRKRNATALPPSIGGGGSVVEKPKESFGALDRYDNPTSIFKAGGERRITRR